MENYLLYLMIFGAVLYCLPSIFSFGYFILAGILAWIVGALFGFNALALCAICIGGIAAFILAAIIIMIPFALLSNYVEGFKQRKEAL